MMGKDRKNIQADEVISHYTESYDESNRLTDGFGQLEKARTNKLLFPAQSKKSGSKQPYLL